MEENHVSYFAIIPANVRYDEDLTPNAKLLYGEITALCNMKGYCWASNSYFASLYKVSTVSISKWVKQLVDKGYIESVMKYREGTKEIEYRYLTIVNGGIKEKLNTPIKEKFKDNNTVINNTNNNISSDKSEVDKVVDKYKELKNLPGFNKITPTRKKAINARIREEGLEKVIAVLEKLNQDQYYIQAKNDGLNWYKFDYVFNPTKFNMLIERFEKNNFSLNNNTNSHQAVSQYQPVNENLYGDVE